MKLLVYIAHPAQYFFLRGAILHLIEMGDSPKIIIKSKDVLESLIVADGISYTNILPHKRANSKWSIFTSLLKRNLKLIPIIRKYKPDLMMSSDASIAELGWLFKIPRVTILEDDIDIIRPLARLTFPFTSHILCPQLCNVGKYSEKKVGYNGLMKLSYLHPYVFNPNKKILAKYSLPPKYAILRLSGLNAHHDFGILGISLTLTEKIVKLLVESQFKVYISSEEHLPEHLEKYQLKIESIDMHHILAFANFLISDSQSMSVEASILGIPSIRISSFAGKISVLEELEQRYNLTFGFKPNNDQAILAKLKGLIGMKQRETVFTKRKEKLLTEKIDVSTMLTWFIENYPKSAAIMKENPDYQYRFK